MVWMISFIHMTLNYIENYSAIADFRALRFTAANTSVLSLLVSTIRFLTKDISTGTVTASLNHTPQISLQEDFSSSDNNLHVARITVRFTLRLADYRQSVRFSAKPLNTQDQSFSTEPLQSQSLCNVLSGEVMDLSFTNIAGPRQRSHS
jgi:hypothetical protein